MSVKNRMEGGDEGTYRIIQLAEISFDTAACFWKDSMAASDRLLKVYRIELV